MNAGPINRKLNCGRARSREEKVRTILDNTPDAVFRYNRAFTRTFANPAMRSLCGCSRTASQNTLRERESVPGQPIERIKILRKSIRDVFKTGRSCELELSLETAKGSRIFDVRLTPEFDLHGSVTSVLGVGRDVTRLHEAEQQLRDANTELTRVTRLMVVGELAGSIAHEISQPIAAVLVDAEAAVSWLERVPPNGKEAGESIARIIQSGKRAAGVITRIRGLFKRTEPLKLLANINMVIDETAGLFEGEFVRNRVSFKTSLVRSSAVLIDPVQLQQVFINLISNSIDSLTTVHGRARLLKIRTERQIGGIKVVIHDNGSGIAPEHVDRMFQPFFSTKPQGLGLGLSISRSIIEAYGGRLWISRNRRHGASMRFCLPLVSEPLQ